MYSYLNQVVCTFLPLKMTTEEIALPAVLIYSIIDIHLYASDDFLYVRFVADVLSTT